MFILFKPPDGSLSIMITLRTGCNYVWRRCRHFFLPYSVLIDCGHHLISHSVDSGWLRVRVFEMVNRPKLEANKSHPFLLIINLMHFFQCIYFTSLHVSSNPVLIIRRINCINTSSGIYDSGRWLYAGQEGTSWPAYQTVIYQSDIYQMMYWYDSPDDKHWVARNM